MNNMVLRNSVQRAGWTLMYALWLSSVGCTGESLQSKHADSGSTASQDRDTFYRTDQADGTVQLTLSVKQATREDVVLKATVTNGTSSSIAWDSEFSIFMQWFVKPVRGDKRVPDGVEISKAADKLINLSRFKVLAPGKSLSKEIALT